MTLITPIKRNGHRGRGIVYVSSRPSAAENIEPNAGYIGFEYQSVRTQSLDTFCTAQDIRKIDFLRCDIEGGEILMLEGGKATISYHQPVIMIEVHPRFLIERYGRSANELWEKLTNLRYVMFYLSENNLVKATHFSDEICWRLFLYSKDSSRGVRPNATPLQRDYPIALLADRRRAKGVVAGGHARERLLGNALAQAPVVAPAGARNRQHRQARVIAGRPAAVSGRVRQRFRATRKRSRGASWLTGKRRKADARSRTPGARGCRMGQPSGQRSAQCAEIR